MGDAREVSLLQQIKTSLDTLRNETCCKLREANEMSSTPYAYTSLATTNSTLVSAGETKLYGIIASNTSGTNAYLKLYNKATAPTVGTDTPVMTILIPASSSVSPIMVHVPIEFSLGLGFGLTGGAAASNTTAVGAGDILLTVLTD